MPTPRPIIDLGLSARNTGCGCGNHASPSQGPEHRTPDGPIIRQILVTGMTCGHCVTSVTEELSGLAGVESVDVQLNPGGASTVTVASAVPLDPVDLHAAVDEAGYSIAGR